MFSVKDFDVKKYDAILDKGLSFGLGNPLGQVCIEAAICQALGLPHGDDPKCVAKAVRSFKIRLNDSRWSSPKARAEGMRDLGLAQLGSLGVVDDTEFAVKVAKKTIQRVVASLYRDLYPLNSEILSAAKRCEEEGTREAALNIRKYATYAAYAADAAYAAYAAADTADAAYAAYAAAYAADAAYAQNKDKYLLISANLALETLIELKSPGVQLLSR
jgi:hypothetical protein